MMNKDNRKKPKRLAKNEIWRLKKDDLYQLAIHLLEITPEANKIVSKWISKKAKKAVLPEARKVGEKERINPNDEVLMEIWDRVQLIRSVSDETSLSPLQMQRIQQRMRKLTIWKSHVNRLISTLSSLLQSVQGSRCEEQVPHRMQEQDDQRDQ